MAKPTAKYVAVVGIDFEQFKPAVRVEAGEVIPAQVAAKAELTDLIEQGLIKEKEADK